jgi:cellulose biosynthesis protein BcsQ
MAAKSLRPVLQELPVDAKEPVVNERFSPPLLEALGFQPHDILPQYPTGDGKVVDQAARYTFDEDKFLYTKSNPFLLVELKGRDSNLSHESAQYTKTALQLKHYLLAPNCKTVQWGIITNSLHIQLFRKHGKVIYPATQCLPLTDETIDETVALIRRKIENPPKALTVAIYNNKGGVGKTTSTVNLAAILTFLGKRVLAIDFDPNQKDLTSLLGISPSEGSVREALTGRDIELRHTLHTYRFPVKRRNIELTFDVVPADKTLEVASDKELAQEMKRNGLYKKLEYARQTYDYILIDTPPNWRYFSQLAVYASDVILMPTKHNNLFSLENAAIAIKNYFPEIQVEKGDGSPIPLPIFFNGEKITLPQLAIAQQEINSIIKIAKKEGVDLLPYFYPRYSNAKRDLYIHEVPSYANIAGAAFSRTPAVYRDRSAHEYYKNLAKEYFLQ